MTVIRVEAYNKGDKKNAYIYLTDDTGELKAWCPDQERALALVVGQALPEGWELKSSEYGPQVFPPRPAGGGAKTAFRNTKEGFLLEQQGYERKEERSMRRTALMQAVASAQVDGAYAHSTILELAGTFYDWLSKSPVPANPAAPVAGGVPGSPPSPPAKSSAPHRAQGEPGTPHLVVGLKHGADLSSTDALLAEGALPVVGGVGGRPGEGGQKAGATGEGRDGPDGPPCLHLKGVFEKQMANGDRLSFCSECKAKLEVVKG